MLEAKNARGMYLSSVEKAHRLILSDIEQTITRAAENRQREIKYNIADGNTRKEVGIYLTYFGYEVWGQADNLIISWKAKEEVCPHG